MKSYVAHCQSGYYCYDRRVIVDRPLRDHQYSQCGITHDNSGETLLFVSYETIVCEISKDGWFHLNGVFSVTTSKQIGWFLREWCNDYSHRRDLCNYPYLRKMWEKGLDVNLYHGDTRPALDGVVQTIGVRCNCDW